MKKLSVIIPVYNEKDTISEIIRRVKASPFPKELIIVDDCSTDGTSAILKQISDPPIVLYLKGDSEIFTKFNDKFFAIVGSRKTTSYGQQTTLNLSQQLASAGLIITSGMAVGIDTFAHQGALDVKKPTVAVLGCGVDIIYPPQNWQLYHQIIKSGGAIISEFPPGHRVNRGLFVSRNRIISGICKGVLIVEGGDKSGALITASYAASQGRDVFAIPSPISSVSSKAPNNLIKQGAKLVTESQDILEEYKLTYPNQQLSTVDFSGLSNNQQLVIKLLQSQSLSADDLSQKLNYTIDQLFSLLTELEIQKVVAKNNEGKYYLV